jgi:hypothetical protein
VDERFLTAQERDVLRAVVAVDVPHPAAVAGLEAQIAVARVTGISCKCGCPSYALVVAKDSALPVALSEFGADYGDESGGGFRVTLNDGYLADVEVYWYGDEPPTRWPSASQFHP